jgi:hypothetical protein
MTVEQAAAAARERAPSLRLSSTWWRSVENGYEPRDEGLRPVSGLDYQVAHMARAVSLSPERLETEGARPDAAIVLREMLRSDPADVLAAVRERWGRLEDAPRDIQVIVRTTRLPAWSKLEVIEGYGADGLGDDAAAARRRA